MYFPKQLFILLACFLIGCSHSSSFNREVWVDNPDIKNTSNPRARMVQDVMKNHLKTGMSRMTVLNSAKAMVAINNFYKMYAKPVMILRYPIGWSTIDPNFLIIKLNGKRQVEEYWIEQG